MEVFDAVRTVLAVRQFQEKPVPEPIVHQIVEAGHLTASSMNGQPWHFIVVEDKETLRQLGALHRRVAISRRLHWRLWWAWSTAPLRSPMRVGPSSR